MGRCLERKLDFQKTFAYNKQTATKVDIMGLVKITVTAIRSITFSKAGQCFNSHIKFFNGTIGDGELE